MLRHSKIEVTSRESYLTSVSATPILILSVTGRTLSMYLSTPLMDVKGSRAQVKWSPEVFLRPSKALGEKVK